MEFQELQGGSELKESLQSDQENSILAAQRRDLLHYESKTAIKQNVKVPSCVGADESTDNLVRIEASPLQKSP